MPKLKDIQTDWRTDYIADRRKPGGGPQTDIEEKGHYPVMQISWYDAKAYALWAGICLPTEASECATPGGLKIRRGPWDDEFMKKNQFANQNESCQSICK